jgi:hypothetical protein
MSIYYAFLICFVAGSLVTLYIEHILLKKVKGKLKEKVQKW